MRPRPGPRPRPGDAPRAQLGPRPDRTPDRTPDRGTGARRLHTGRLAIALVAALLLAGVVIVSVERGGSTPAGSAEGSAAQPRFGASLPVSASATGGGSDAEYTDAAAVADLLDAATTAIQTVDSYDYRRLAADRTAGQQVSTGVFGTGYSAAMRGAIATSAPRSHTVQLATVQKVGVSALAGDRARVLAFGRVQISDTSSPDARTSVLAVGVNLLRSSGIWRIDEMADLSSGGSFATVPPGNAALGDAVTSAAREVLDLLSYSRNNFAGDFTRAVDGLTSTLRAQQETLRDGLQQSMTKDSFDFAAQVRSIGVESVAGNSVLLIIGVTGYRVGDDGILASGNERFEVGVMFDSGRWLVSQFLTLPDQG